jgi:hypothetical protein
MTDAPESEPKSVTFVEIAKRIERSGGEHSGSTDSVRWRGCEAGADPRLVELDAFRLELLHQSGMIVDVETDVVEHAPVRKSPTGSTITYITDPWGTRIEIVQRAPLGPQVTAD